jgi:hypothetical protein
MIGASIAPGGVRKLIADFGCEPMGLRPAPISRASRQKRCRPSTFAARHSNVHCASTQFSDPVTLTATFEKKTWSGLSPSLP